LPPAREHPDQAEARAHVPGTAAAFAEIDDGQAHELVAARLSLHSLQQIACLALGCVASRALPLRLAHAQGEAIALVLELRQREQMGSAQRRCRARDR